MEYENVCITKTFKKIQLAGYFGETMVTDDLQWRGSGSKSWKMCMCVCEGGGG